MEGPGRCFLTQGDAFFDTSGCFPTRAVPSAVSSGAGGLPPGAVQIELSEQEAAAVARLEGMGFDRQQCLEAFLACDRNEELAANYLLEHGNEDM